MKHLVEFDRSRGAVFVYFHDLSHVVPPATADLRLGNCFPTEFVLDLRIGKKLSRTRMEGYRIVVNAMLTENFFQLLPNRIVAPLIFLFGTAFQLHDKEFAYHLSLSSAH